MLLSTLTLSLKPRFLVQRYALLPVPPSREGRDVTPCWISCPWHTQSLLVSDCNLIASAKSSVFLKGFCGKGTVTVARTACTAIRIWVEPRHLDFGGGCSCAKEANPSFSQVLTSVGQSQLPVPTKELVCKWWLFEMQYLFELYLSPDFEVSEPRCSSWTNSSYFVRLLFWKWSYAPCCLLRCDEYKATKKDLPLILQN